jgi:hypothetical protein
MPRSEQPVTLHAVGQMLGAGGWNEHVSNSVKRWWRLNRMTAWKERRLERNRRLFSEMVQAKLDDRDRLVLGRYIGLIARQHFDAGLTMGLMAHVEERTRNTAPATGRPMP